MVGTLHIHDLLLLRGESAVTSAEGVPCPYLNLNQRPWVVVRRGLSEVLETRRPDQLRLILAEDSRRTLQAFRSLSYLESHLVGLNMSWGPGGSVGYELASGVAAVHVDSDLDFIFSAPQRLDITEAQDLWRMIRSAPGKVDALVETPLCGFSLEEFVTASPRKMLLRTSDGRILGSNPWNLLDGKDS